MYEERNHAFSWHSELLIHVGQQASDSYTYLRPFFFKQKHLYRFIVGSDLCKDVKPGNELNSDPAHGLYLFLVRLNLFFGPCKPDPTPVKTFSRHKCFIPGHCQSPLTCVEGENQCKHKVD